MKNKGIVRYIILFFEGIIVGFGAIMPGISGGTLCVAFGMYRPIIEVLSHPKKSIKQYIGILIPFVLGGVVGFLGLSGLASWLLDKNTYMMVCVFIGFIIGTFPELWKDAGKKGRNSKSYMALIIGFLVMMLVLMLFRSESMVMIRPGISGFVVCGVLWGLSFIVPGLSSSTLLLFFGIYQPMLDGISKLRLNVILPLGIGMGVCVILFSKLMNMVYEKYYSVISHVIFGVVLATTIMIFPDCGNDGDSSLKMILCIFAGGVTSNVLTSICNRLAKDSI